jgi:hypothetical protein
MFIMKAKFSFFLALPFLALTVLSIFVMRVPAVEAATLFLSPQVGQYQIGQTFEVVLSVDGQSQGFNAAQATIQFPKDILQVKSLDFSSASSVFNFWLQQPSFSNSNGQISLIGGSTTGLNGSSLGILKITFSAVGGGDAIINLSDAAVTASDGSGSNILSSVVTAQYRVVSGSNTPGLPKTATTTPPTVKKPVAIPTPTPIVRTPTVVKKLPAAPVVTVPLYPDQKRWYSVVSNFLTQWTLPNDISGVSTAIDQNSKFTPPAKSEGLFEAKAFPALSDGIWYLHVMFQNNVGWSSTTNYRIAIDSVPPLPFTITASEATTTDSPIRTLHFKTSDGLSGMDHYLVRVDSSDEVVAATSTFTLMPQTPGKHNVTVKAVDAAGNIQESSFSFEIIPIASPAITFIDKNVYAGISNLNVGGSTIASGSVVAILKKSNGDSVAVATAIADSNGNWQANFNGPFKIGQYFVEATAQDSRGALSLPVKSEIFSVREKPLLVIGTFEIIQLWFFVGLIGVIIILVFFWWLARYLWRKQVARRTIVAQRDVNNVVDRATEKLDRVIRKRDDGKLTTHEANEEQVLLKETDKKLKKQKKYITDDIKEIDDK